MTDAASNIGLYSFLSVVIVQVAAVAVAVVVHRSKASQRQMDTVEEKIAKLEAEVKELREHVTQCELEKVKLMGLIDLKDHELRTQQMIEMAVAKRENPPKSHP